jgi:hypothetical protein
MSNHKENGEKINKEGVKAKVSCNWCVEQKIDCYFWPEWRGSTKCGNCVKRGKPCIGGDFDKGEAKRTKSNEVIEDSDLEVEEIEKVVKRRKVSVEVGLKKKLEEKLKKRSETKEVEAKRINLEEKVESLEIELNELKEKLKEMEQIVEEIIEKL